MLRRIRIRSCCIHGKTTLNGKHFNLYKIYQLFAQPFFPSLWYSLRVSFQLFNFVYQYLLFFRAIASSLCFSPEQVWLFVFFFNLTLVLPLHQFELLVIKERVILCITFVYFEFAFGRWIKRTISTVQRAIVYVSMAKVSQCSERFFFSHLFSAFSRPIADEQRVHETQRHRYISKTLCIFSQSNQFIIIQSAKRVRNIRLVANNVAVQQTKIAIVPSTLCTVFIVNGFLFCLFGVCSTDSVERYNQRFAANMQS